MDDVQTAVQMPKFDRDNIQLYVNDLETWLFLTELNKKKQALVIWMSLPNDDPSNIKQSITNSIGNKMKEGEDAQTFINRFNAVYNAISKKQTMITNSTRSLILVQKAGISDQLGRMVTHRIDFKKDDFYEEMTRSLIRLMGDSKKKKKNAGRK